MICANVTCHYGCIIYRNGILLNGLFCILCFFLNTSWTSFQIVSWRPTSESLKEGGEGYSGKAAQAILIANCLPLPGCHCCDPSMIQTPPAPCGSHESTGLEATAACSLVLFLILKMFSNISPILPSSLPFFSFHSFSLSSISFSPYH